MARKELVFTVETEGRDKSKKYLIKEMPASQAEEWAIRVMLGMGKAGIDIPDELLGEGMAGLVKIGLMNLMRIPYVEAQPLLAEMMACVKRIESAITRDLVEDDIEEVSTRLQLRKAIFELHTGFFATADQSTSESVQSAQANANTLNIRMPRKR